MLINYYNQVTFFVEKLLDRNSPTPQKFLKEKENLTNRYAYQQNRVCRYPKEVQT